MRNVIKTFALNSLKSNKKRKNYLFTSIFIVSALLFGVINVIDAYIHQEQLEAIQNFGSYYFAIENINDTQQEELYHHPYITKQNKLHFYGMFEGGMMGYSEDISLLPIYLYRGKMPSTSQEIAMERSTLLEMNLPLALNQEIELTYQLLDGQNKTETFILSGIYETSPYMLTSSLQAFTTSRDEITTTHFYYQSKTAESYLYDYEAIENIGVLKGNQTINATQQSLVSMVMVMGAALMMYTLNLLVDEIIQELMYLRMMGASKMQVASIFFYQLAYVSILAIPLGGVVGWMLSALFCISQELLVTLEIPSLLTGLVVILLTLLIGSALPIIKACQSSLTGSMRLKRKVIRVHSMKKITLIRLILRHMHFYRMTYLMFIILSALCLTLLTSRFERIQDVLTRDISPHQEASITIYGGNLSEATIDEISKITGFSQLEKAVGQSDQHQELVSFHVNNVYDPVYGQENVQAEIKILKLDESHPLKKHQVMIYLPRVYLKVFEDGSISRYPEYLIPEDKGYELVYEDRIQVGDVIEINGVKHSIDYILTDDDFESVTNTVYTVFVSNDTLEKVTYHEATLKVKEGISFDYLISNIFRIVGKHEEGNVSIIENEANDFNQLAFLVKESVYLITILFLIILLLYQQIHTQYESRSKDLMLYQIVGMSRKQVKSFLLMEGILLGAYAILMHLFFQITPHLISAMNSGDFSRLTLSHLFVEEWMMGYVILYGMVMGFVVLVYQMMSRRLLKQKTLSNLIAI